jgi:hypothetical protein
MSDQKRELDLERIRKEQEEERKRNERGAPTIEQFDQCPKHGTRFPAGGVCPKCR